MSCRSAYLPRPSSAPTSAADPSANAPPPDRLPRYTRGGKKARSRDRNQRPARRGTARLLSPTRL